MWKKSIFLFVCSFCFLTGCNKQENVPEETYEIEETKENLTIEIETGKNELTEKNETKKKEKETKNYFKNFHEITESTSKKETTTETKNTETETTEKVYTVVPSINSNYRYEKGNEYSKYIFIGDSRTEGMKQAVNSEDVWSCKISQGFQWMKDTGVPMIESEITENTAVVILMGVNDTYNVHKYISYINEKAEEWNQIGATTYFVSVNPIESDPYITNTEIEEFNQLLKSGLTAAHYIDTYNDLMINGFKTTDGIHYTKETYRQIYKLIKDKL